MVPAVEYIQANRVRTKLMEAMAEVMSEVDAFLTPSRTNLYAGNFTGHPMISIPNGFDRRNMPTSIGLFGRLYDETNLLALADALQRATDHHLKHPGQFGG
jgi:Asp-tRNA(Asn)/Glu-tRNA(Gln) amidotransferase A subunit family amidase